MSQEDLVADSLPQLVSIVDHESLLPTSVQTVGVSAGKLAAEEQDRRDVHVHDFSTAYLVKYFLKKGSVPK